MRVGGYAPRRSRRCGGGRRRRHADGCLRHALRREHESAPRSGAVQGLLRRDVRVPRLQRSPDVEGRARAGRAMVDVRRRQTLGVLSPERRHVHRRDGADGGGREVLARAARPEGIALALPLDLPPDRAKGAGPTHHRVRRARRKSRGSRPVVRLLPRPADRLQGPLRQGRGQGLRRAAHRERALQAQGEARRRRGDLRGTRGLETALSRRGGAAPRTAGPNWFHPGTLGWNPAWKPDAYDPARAKKLLADAGYPNGFTIPVRLFTMPGTTELPALGEAVAGYWEKIGVRADLIRTEWVVHRPDLVKRGFKGATIYRGFPQVEPVTVWRLAYHSKGDFGEREDPFVDSVLDTLAATVNAKEREALAKKLGDFLVTDFATLPMVSASYLYGTNPKTVKAWQPTRGKYPDRFEWVVPAR